MSISVRERLIGILGIIVGSSLPLVILSSFATFAQPGLPDSSKPAATPSPPEATTKQPSVQEVWRRQMARTPFPKPGCYTSSYPSNEWQEVPCSTAPARPHPTNGDYSAVVSGAISSATGSFDSVTGATGESDTLAGANNFSLQLNANSFSSNLCTKPSSSCASQQYVYDSPGNVYIQYWVFQPKPCPTQTVGPPGNIWGFYDGSSGGRIGCYINGNQATPSTPQAITDLAKLTLTAINSSSQQEAKLEAADGTLSGSADPGDFLSFGTQWTNAEFNVFGWGNGSTASLTPNPGTTVVVRTSVDNGTTNAPTLGGGITEESNNLTLIPSPCLIGGASPAIVFTESNAPGATGSCGPQCTSTLTCSGSQATFPNLTVTCPSAVYFKNDGGCAGTTQGGIECGTNSDVRPPLLVCYPGTNTCTGYSLSVLGGFCGRPIPPPPLPPGDNCCTLCRKQGLLCTVNPNGKCSACQ
jgi:hypothetical protein